MNNLEKIIEISYEDLEKISGGMKNGDQAQVQDSGSIDGIYGCVKFLLGETNNFYNNAKAGKSDFVNGLLSEYGCVYVYDEKSGWKFDKTKALNFSGVFGDDIPKYNRAGSIVGLSAFVVAGSFALKKIKGFFNAIC